MANSGLFSPETPSAGLFTGHAENARPEPRVDSQRAERLGVLRAGASFNPSGGAAFAEYLQTIRSTQQDIEEQGAESTRLTAAREQQARRLATLQNLNPNDASEDAAAFTGAFNDIAKEAAERRSVSALEEDFVDNLSAIARMDMEIDRDITDLEAAAEWDIRHLMWQSIIDENVESREARPWGWGLFELLALASVPFYTSTSMSGELTEDESATFSENIFAGQNLRDQSAHFHAQLDQLETRQEQYAYMRAVSEALRERARHFGYEDQNLHQFMMQEMWDPLPGVTTNIFNGLDNVPIVSWGVNLARKGIVAGTRAGIRAGTRGARQRALRESLEDLEPSASKTVRDGLEEFLDEAPADPQKVSPGGFALRDPAGEVPTRNTSPILGTLDRQGGREAIEAAVAAALQVGAREGAEEGARVLGSRYAGDLFSAVSVSAMNPWGRAVRVSVAGSVSHMLATAEAALRQATESLLPTRRLTDDEMARAVSSAEESLRERAGRDLVDVEVISSDLADTTSVSTVVATVGRANGQAFRTLRGAERYAREWGLPVRSIDESPEGFWVRMEMPVNERAFYVNPLDMKATRVASRHALSQRNVTDRALHDASLLSEATYQEFRRKVLQPWAERARRVPAGIRDNVAQIWSIGSEQGRWFTREEFRHMFEAVGKAADEETAWRHYRDQMQMSDIDYLVRDAEEIRHLVTNGFEMFNIRGLIDEFTPGRVLSELDPKRPIWIADIVEGTGTSGYVREAGEALADGIPEGYVAVQLREPRTIRDFVVDTVLVRRSDVEFRPVGNHVFPYRAGGHRMPQGNWFVRQAVRHVQPDGNTVMRTPRTFIGARTVGEAKAWVETMEELRGLLIQQVRNGVDVRRQIDELIEGRRGFRTADEYIEMASRGQFNLDDAFEVLEGRSLPSAYKTESARRLRMFDEDATGGYLWAVSQNGLYSGRRGDDILRNFQGDSVRHLNMYEMMNRSLGNIGRIVSLSDYKTELINRFDATYRAHVINADSLSPEELFYRGALHDDTPIPVRESFLAQRDHGLRILGHQTPFQRRLRDAQLQLISAADNIVGGIAGKRAGRITGRAVDDMMNWWNTTNPVQGLRGAAFDLKLGLFNPVQLFLQMSTAITATTALNPRHGIPGALNAWPIRMMMINEGFTETLISRGFHKTMGWDATELREFLNLANNSGFLRIDGNHALINEGGSIAAFDNFARGRIQRIREAGRFFFNEAETYNRLVAGQVAFRILKETAPELAADSAEFARRWVGLTDDYSLNMSRASGASWQSGLSSIPTQFWSYGARMTEAMFGKQFTLAQRARLIATQTALFGAAGVPLIPLIESIRDLMGGAPAPTGDAPDLNSVEAFWRRGLLDHMIYWSSGLDVKASERISIGRLFGDILKDAYNQSDYGQVSFVDFIGGATLSIWKDLGEDALDVGRYVGAELGRGDLDFMSEPTRARDAMIRLAQNISTFNNSFKAWNIHQYHVYISSNYGERQPLARNLPEGYAFTQAVFGYQPGIMDELGADFDYLTDERREERVRDLAGFFQHYRRMLIQASDEGNTERVARLTEEMTLWVEVTSERAPTELNEALRLAGNDWVTSLAEQVAQTVERQQSERQILGEE